MRIQIYERDGVRFYAEAEYIATRHGVIPALSAKEVRRIETLVDRIVEALDDIELEAPAMVSIPSVWIDGTTSVASATTTNNNLEDLA